MSESLFASDYSLSPTSPTTPTSFRGLSPRPSASPIPSRSSPLRSNSTYESPLDAEIAAKQSSAPPLSPSQVLGEGRKSLEVVFPTPNIYPTPPASPARVESTSSHAPSLASSTRTSKTDSEIIDVDPLDRPVVIERKKSGHGGYTTYEGCLEGEPTCHLCSVELKADYHQAGLGTKSNLGAINLALRKHITTSLAPMSFSASA